MKHVFLSVDFVKTNFQFDHVGDSPGIDGPETSTFLQAEPAVQKASVYPYLGVNFIASHNGKPLVSSERSEVGAT
jgi:hypothetical protein